MAGTPAFRSPAVAAAHPASTVAAPRRPRWRDPLIRFGFAARGVVYILIGVTAVMVSVGIAERTRGSPGVMRLLHALPFGPVLVAIVGAGLLSYALLSFVAAIDAPAERRVGALRRWATRGADGVAGAVYLGLAAGAVRLLAEPADRAGSLGEWWARLVLAAPLGRVWLAAAGVTVASAGAYQMHRAVAHSFQNALALGAARPWFRLAISGLARTGTAARGILFIVCGLLAVRAAVAGDPALVGTVAAALTLIGAQPAGAWLLAAVGAGCIAYGGYQLAKSRYRRVDLAGPSPPPSPP